MDHLHSHNMIRYPLGQLHTHNMELACQKPLLKTDSLSVDLDRYTYCKGLVSNLNELRKNREKCDIILKVDNELFYCHSLILISQTDYFKNLLTNKNFSEHSQEIIELTGVDKDVFKKILDSLYGEPLNVKDDVVPLIQLCDYLQLPEYFFKRKIEEYLIASFSKEIALQLVHLPCLKTSYLRIHQMVIDFFAAKRKCEDVKECTFELSLDVFSDILASFKFDLDHLSELLWYCERWVQKDPGNRSKYIDRLTDVIFKRSVIIDETKKQKLRARTGEMIQELVDSKGTSLNLNWLSLDDQSASGSETENMLILFTKKISGNSDPISLHCFNTNEGLPQEQSWQQKGIQKTLPITFHDVFGVVYDNNVYILENLKDQKSFYFADETGTCHDLQMPHRGVTDITCCRSMIYTLYSQPIKRKYGFYDTNINRWFYLSYDRLDDKLPVFTEAKEWITGDQINGGLYSVSRTFKEILYHDLRAGIWKKINVIDNQPEFWNTEWISFNYYDEKLIISTRDLGIFTVDLRNEQSYCNRGSKFLPHFHLSEMENARSYTPKPHFSTVTSHGTVLWFYHNIIRSYDLHYSEWRFLEKYSYSFKPLSP